MKRCTLLATLLAAVVLNEAIAFGQPTAITEFRLSREAIDAGRVTAVRGSQSEAVTASTLAAQAAAGAVFVERLRARPIVTTLPPALATGRAETGTKLSYQITARSAATRQPVKLDAWARDSTGLLLDGSRSVYAGQFVVALVNAQNPADRSTLATPVAVAVTAQGATSIAPHPLRIAELAQWHDVSIVVPDVRGTRFPVAVSADPNSAGDAIELSVSQPSIRVWSTPASIVGWGIGQGTIHLAATGMRVAEGFRVALHSTHGSLTSGTVTLDAGGHGSTRLRSSGGERTVITVQNAALQSAPLDVAFDAPWLFLGAAMAGGLAGAFVRGRGRARWRGALAIGVVSALIMTLAYAAGIDWPARVLNSAGIDRSGEAVVFVLGAIGALVGVSALVLASGR